MVNATPKVGGSANGSNSIDTPNWQVYEDSSNNLVFVNVSTGNVILRVNVNGTIEVQAGTGPTFSTSGLLTRYNNITTAGLGLAAVYAAGAQTLNTNAAPTTLSYTPPATAGVYRFTGYLNALTAGTMTFRVKITYKDAGGNAVTDIPGFYLQNTTAIVAGGNTANTAGRYTMLSYPFSIDNSATAITIQDNAGTYTAGTYFWTPVLEQLA